MADGKPAHGDKPDQRRMEAALRPYFSVVERGMDLLVTCECGQSWLMRKEPPQPNNVAWLLKHAAKCQRYKAQ